MLPIGFNQCAPVVEQVDTQDLKSCGLTAVPVRFRSGVPKSERETERKRRFELWFFFILILFLIIHSSKKQSESGISNSDFSSFLSCFFFSYVGLWFYLSLVLFLLFRLLIFIHSRSVSLILGSVSHFFIPYKTLTLCYYVSLAAVWFHLFFRFTLYLFEECLNSKIFKSTKKQSHSIWNARC